jgi:hypothetical protein
MNEPTYRTETVTLGPNSVEWIIRTDADGKEWWIPVDPANSDYQAYLASQKEEK